MDADRVVVSTVTQGEFQEFIPVTGVVTPLRTFYLDAVQGGTVAGVYVEEGAMVTAGDSILRLDNTDLRLDIMYREAQLFEQINNLRNTRLAMEQHSLDLRARLLDVEHEIIEAKRAYDQAAALKNEDLITDNEFEQAKEDLDYWTSKKQLTIESERQDSLLRIVQVQQLESSVSRMQTNLEFVRKKLEELLLRAPIDGQLTSLNAEVGESKRIGQRLGQIDVSDGVKLQADVDEYYVARISPGLKGEATITGEVYTLKVVKVHPEISDGRFRVDMEFDGQAPADLRRGQSVQARLLLGDLSQAVLLPRGDFYNTTGGRWVYVLGADGEEATKRNIELGRQNSENYEVVGGLKPGDRVITSSYEPFAQYERIVLK
jgi:HlyD family secretion protein